MMHTHTCTHAEAELRVDIAHRTYAHPYTHMYEHTSTRVCVHHVDTQYATHAHHSHEYSADAHTCVHSSRREAKGSGSVSG